MNQQTIHINTYDSEIVEKIDADSDILVLVDATEGSFTINLPDGEGFEDSKLTLRRVDDVRSIDGVLNAPIINPRYGQLINNEDTQKLTVGSAPTMRVARSQTTDRMNWWTV